MASDEQRSLWHPVPSPVHAQRVPSNLLRNSKKIRVAWLKRDTHLVMRSSSKGSRIFVYCRIRGNTASHPSEVRARQIPRMKFNLPSRPIH